MKRETTKKRLNRIKDMLGASTIDLGNALGGLRPDVENWLSGRKMPASAAKRLKDLALAAEAIELAGFAFGRGVLRRKILNGQTLLQLLERGMSIHEVAVPTLIEMMRREAAENARLSMRLAGRAHRTENPDFDFPAAG